ncbi:hypothetical protein ACS0TY_004400 [Phlomoides rotata]
MDKQRRTESESVAYLNENDSETEVSETGEDETSLESNASGITGEEEVQDPSMDELRETLQKALKELEVISTMFEEITQRISETTISESNRCPSTATLVIKALKERECKCKKTKNIKHNDNISLDDVIEIAKVMKSCSMAKDLSVTVKEILGTCVYVGFTIDGKDPKDL